MGRATYQRGLSLLAVSLLGLVPASTTAEDSPTAKSPGSKPAVTSDFKSDEEIRDHVAALIKGLGDERFQVREQSVGRLLMHHLQWPQLR